jgi:hypothetical protein
LELPEMMLVEMEEVALIREEKAAKKAARRRK